MKLFAIFRFECGYQIRRPWPLLIFLALVALTALFVSGRAASENEP